MVANYLLNGMILQVGDVPFFLSSRPIFRGELFVFLEGCPSYPVPFEKSLFSWGKNLPCRLSLITPLSYNILNGDTLILILVYLGKVYTFRKWHPSFPQWTQVWSQQTSPKICYNNLLTLWNLKKVYASFFKTVGRTRRGKNISKFFKVTLFGTISDLWKGLKWHPIGESQGSSWSCMVHDHVCMVYLRTFTIKNQPNVGRNAIHG